MRAAVLLLCLTLVRYNSARIPKTYVPNMDGLTLEEQIKIHQYEQDILQMKLKKQKISTTHAPKETAVEWAETRTTGESLIALQELLTLDKNANQEKKDPERIFIDALAITRHMSEKDKQSIGAAFAENKEVNCKNATQLIEENDYIVEKHDVKTTDGYYITLFRIESQHGSQEVSDRPVVLMVHGLFGSADDWLLMGPKKSLAYQMTEAGFDVWLGNLRGSKYSQRHASKYPALPDFWEFGIDEIAAHDLPTMINYTLKITREDKLHYVGHSLGATAFFAMASAHPKYREKVTMMYALSPMVYMNHVRSPLLRMISPKSRYYKTVNQLLGYGELKPNNDFMHIIGGKMYENITGTKQVASNLKYVVSGVHSADMDRKMIPNIMKCHTMSFGASVKLVKHYGQAKAAGQLRKYDHGVELNKEVYGQSEPPSYNMSKVHVPVAIYFSEEDLLAHPTDVEKLHSELPQVKDYYKVPEQHFSHMDFQFSKKAPTTINERLISSIKNKLINY